MYSISSEARVRTERLLSCVSAFFPRIHLLVRLRCESSGHLLCANDHSQMISQIDLWKRRKHLLTSTQPMMSSLSQIVDVCVERLCEGLGPSLRVVAAPLPWPRIVLVALKTFLDRAGQWCSLIRELFFCLLVVAASKELRETVLMPRVADPKRWSLDTGGAPVSCVCGLNRVPEPQR
jgi:hypothetical protein